ncbi:Alpha/Beta hydrolase protein [Neohortaea acidophila]|uniref:triacylglycerol lipase n=1 Tax=Neohortaea acidophila TaxID=245834 RepID=A0A6A6Q610_9PEZI|nr:Alpha/Beta hydrolase protein [Neohortaea acidophila]KAF2487820.1 Alpha/Beta hydrolase protein [Neohortaea acidophila]
MQCPSWTPRRTRDSTNMPRVGNVLLACAVWLVGFNGLVSAVESPRAPTDPYFLSPPGFIPDDNAPHHVEDRGELEFTLRSIYHHGVSKHPNLHRYMDIPANAQVRVADEDSNSHIVVPQSLRARTTSSSIERLADRNRSRIDGLLDHALAYGQAASLPSSAWTTDEVIGPDISDKSTVITLAWAAANAYVQERLKDPWHEIGGGFNTSDDFGWEGDGLRGHIFATKDNSTIVIGLKGTSTAILLEDETSERDKENDNLFGSCCCAQGGNLMWTPVCDCMTDTFTCNQTCLVKQLRRKSRYYLAAQELYHNVTERYPNSEIWLTGHSLGGVVSTLLGLTYGLPVVTFEAYPDAMAASRLGLPTPPGYHAGAHQSRTDVGIHHFGHTADPVFVGQCHGPFSPCSLTGYALESACHTGKKCAYDTVNDLNWRSSVRWHSIIGVIKDVLMAYDTAANCTTHLDCVDCFAWKFFESNGTETTTSSTSRPTSTYTRTRTETCKTPGWWGCLDETTTFKKTTTTSTSTSTTSTCKTPGWFGCKDPTTTKSTTTITKSSARHGPAITTVTTTTTTTPTSSTTCETPGWLGRCRDSTTSPSTTPKPSSPPSKPTPTATKPPTGCASRKWFGLVCADPTSTTSLSTPSPSRLPTTRRKVCARRHWYGLCKEWRWEEVIDPKSDL